MKFNKITAGVVTFGAVGLAGVAHAEDMKSSVVGSASSTVLSGFVDTSAEWNLGEGTTYAPSYKYGGAAKADGFNLNVVGLTLEKPIDEDGWASGYKVDIFLGPDANTLGTDSTFVKNDFALKQAYVTFRVPVGTGLDFKAGVVNSLLGYESAESYKNANFTRSWGHTIEPSELTALLASYKLVDGVVVNAGIGNTISPAVNGRPVDSNGNQSETHKAYTASLVLTAPDDWGFLAGSALTTGFINGYNNSIVGGTNAANQTSFYVGATAHTPVKGLDVGASFDYLCVAQQLTAQNSIHSDSLATYASYKLTEKISLHGRFEYFSLSRPISTELNSISSTPLGIASKITSLTGTLQYDLWKNIVSRLELRWDHAADGSTPFGNASVAAGGGASGTTGGGFTYSGNRQDSWNLLLNLVYKF
jgi:hypothetical protein